MDLEIQKLVEECYARTKELLESKRDLIEALSEKLLEQESINLPTIIEVLGERPFPMKESLKDYLRELEARKESEERAAFDAEASAPDEENAAGTDQSKQPESQEDDPN